MDRRRFLRGLAALPLLGLGRGGPELLGSADREGGRPRAGADPLDRVRPGDPGWPSGEEWAALKRRVGGRLSVPRWPLEACRTDPDGAACAGVFRELGNPFYIGDDPALTQTTGWADAWTSRPSAYVVAAEGAADVAAAVDFAREHRLRLVVKGGGHSYQGRSSAPDSLLVWTRRMDGIELHDAFVPAGCEGKARPLPAVSVGAGCIWLHVYDAVTTRGGRYVQGGGCTTVGVAGLVASGGFGSFSKRFGLAAAGLLEAEVVTADGRVRTANACTNPDLFWALKGGGGGSFGVVTRLTLRTRELPETFGGVFGTVRAASDATYRDLVRHVLAFYRDALLNPHWGERVHFRADRSLELSMVFQGLSQEEAQGTWKPFTDWLAARPGDFTVERPVTAVALPARRMWDRAYLEGIDPGLVAGDDRPGAPAANFLWAGDHGQVGWFIHGFHSTWLPAALLGEARLDALADAVHEAALLWEVTLQFNKGLAGAPRAEIEAAADTAAHPAALEAFALAIVAGEGPPAFPGLRGHEPDLARARRREAVMRRAFGPLANLVPEPASYLSESDYFQDDWQRSFWGSNHERLAEVKRRYDPDGLFFIHHGVGSEAWSEDGFARRS
ncbi:MAG TPA: FAD-binding protein [Gemmatimonadota bacterium]|nr:FAD-binding protein [Gemmatimonadota bacterium]